MSLSAIDCIGRGIANLRANWELVLLQLAQTAVCSVLAVAGVVGVLALVGASFLLQLSDPRDWSVALERLEDLSVGGGLLAIALAATAILVTIVGLVYSWFQAGIVSTLERGERQAPRRRPVEPQLFRTLSHRNFVGWSHRGAWRYFGFFWLLVLCGAALGGLYVVAAAMVAGAMEGGSGGGLAIVGCLAFLPLIVFVGLLNLWFLLGMALLPREELGVWGAARAALGILARRFGGVVLIALLFVLASAGVGLVFWPLSQGMASALDGSVPAWFAVQFLLTLAQWLVNGVLTVALFASVVALARTELDRRAA